MVHKNRYYAPGNLIMVFYHAAHPARCFMAPATTREMLTVTAPMAGSFVFGLGYLIAGFKILRRPDSRAAVATGAHASVPKT